jgi:RNA polymerase sigma-70 factor (ECF subfamily)
VSTEPDGHVRELLAGGDAGAAATHAIRALGPSALRYLRGLLPDEDDAKDAFSQWAENVWRGLPSFRGECTLRVWAFRLAYHAALDLKAQAWRRHGRRLATTEASRIAESVRTSSAIRMERQQSVLQRLIQTLTPEEQTLIELRVQQRLSWAEIADVLGQGAATPQPTALAKRFQRLKEHLTQMLRQERAD